MESQTLNDGALFLQNLAQGPLFRFAFALLALGLLRVAVLGLSDVVGAYLTLPDRREFWRKLRQRVLWFVFPSLVLREAGLGGGPGLFAYHVALSCTSLIFRLGVLLVPAFMAAHVRLWERGLGLSWPALPGTLADVLAVITIVAGFVLFLGRIYSPVLRSIESPWSFLRPLALLVPFLTGFLAMHPAWCPLDYSVVLLLHIVSAALVFVLIPFTRLLSSLSVPLTRVVPAAAWRNPQPAEIIPAAAGRQAVPS